MAITVYRDGTSTVVSPTVTAQNVAISVTREGQAGPAGAPGPNTLSTSTTTALTGLLKGDGSNVAVATAGTDYLAPSALTGLKVTRVFADLAAQNAAMPEFIGQIGYNIEDEFLLKGNNLTAGGWLADFQFNSLTCQTISVGPTGFSSTGPVTGSNLSGINTGDQTDITGNAGTATALQTARSIGGSSFNGTADIEIARAKATSSAGGTLQNLSGTTCFSWGAGSGQNITIPTGTGVSLNATSYTFGTGSAAAFNTALGLTELATTTPGTGVATWLATPSGANLASALTTALPASKGGTGLTALGTGVATALGVNVGSAGAFVTFNGAGGTPSSLTLTNATGLPIAGLVASTTTAIGVGSIELGHATDTTITRVSAGRIAVEGVNVVTVSSTDTLTNKTLTSPTIDAITTAGSMTLSGAGGSGLFGLKSTSATGYSSMELLNFSGGQMGGFGYANSSAGAYADQVYFYAAGKALVIATTAGSRHLFLSTTGDLSIGSGAAANTKSVLDLTSTTKGFLPPRMTTTQRDAITSPPAGLMIYNTTTNKLNVYTTAWEAVTSA